MILVSLWENKKMILDWCDIHIQISFMLIRFLSSDLIYFNNYAYIIFMYIIYMILMNKNYINIQVY